MRHDSAFKIFSLSLIWVWLGLFALLPFLLVLITSFLEPGTTHLIQYHFSLENYHDIFSSIYAKVFVRSFGVAALSTFICLVLAYPFAFFMATAQDKYKNILLLLLIVPFWTSSLIRTYAIIAVIKTKGILNTILLALGIIHHPIEIMFTNTAVMIGLIYNLLPFMILPLYANLERLDFQLLEAARDLGASKLRMFFQIVFPLSMPGVLAGCILVFLPAMTIFYIPDLLGGAKSMLLGNLIQTEFLTIHNWPMGSTTSIILTAIMGLFLWFYWRKTSSADRKDLV